MSLPVSLQSVVEEMDLPSDEWTAYIHRRTGQLVTLMDDDPEPEIDADEIEASEDFIPLPSKFDIDEYDIMRRFGDSIENDSIADDIASAIRSRGAFRCFKDTIRRHRIEQKWYAFRDKALACIAADFLDEHGIPYQSK